VNKLATEPRSFLVATTATLIRWRWAKTAATAVLSEATLFRGGDGNGRSDPAW
jgi:hypothetical protein